MYKRIDVDMTVNNFVGQTLHDNQVVDDDYRLLMNSDTIRLVSKKITDLLQGVDVKGRKIRVPDQDIMSIIDTEYRRYRPPIGDMYSRIHQMEEQPDKIEVIIERAIEIITSQIKSDKMIEENNKSMSKWNSMYGEHNPAGLVAHTKIKIRENHPAMFQFNMKY